MSDRPHYGSPVAARLNELEDELERVRKQADCGGTNCGKCQQCLQVHEHFLKLALEHCPLCRHKWREHDPEDGCCDSPSSEGIGVCECGRDMAWMHDKIAALSRSALAGNTEGRV